MWDRDRAKAMWNISDFEKIQKRGRLLEGDGLESNEVNFKMDAGPDREPVEIHRIFMCCTWRTG